MVSTPEDGVRGDKNGSHLHGVVPIVSLRLEMLEVPSWIRVQLLTQGVPSECSRDTEC